MTQSLSLSPFLLLILAPLVVHLLRDVRGCVKNCNQGRKCTCGEKR